MPKKILSTDEQIKKLSNLQKIAATSVTSEKLTEKLGGIMLYAGLTDFYAIQSARLLEQVILKYELAQNKTPSFKPKNDEYFYDKRVSTRKIIKEIRKFLPVSIAEGSSGDAQKSNEVAENYLVEVEKFLNYRNALLHHIGSPKVSEDKILKLIQKTVDSFHEMMRKHREFFETWQPYRFSLDEIKYFYSVPENNDT